MFPMQERQLSLSSLSKNLSIMLLGIFLVCLGFFFFSEKIRLEILYESSAKQMIHKMSSLIFYEK